MNAYHVIVKESINTLKEASSEMKHYLVYDAPDESEALFAVQALQAHSDKSEPERQYTVKKSVKLLPNIENKEIEVFSL